MEQHPILIKKPVSNKQPSFISYTPFTPTKPCLIKRSFTKLGFTKHVKIKNCSHQRLVEALRSLILMLNVAN